MIPRHTSTPVLSINRGWAMYVGPVALNRAHQHYAHQIAWSLETELVAIGAHGPVHGAGYLVCSAAVHRVESSAWLQTIYLAPEMQGTQWLVGRAGGSLAVLTLLEARQLSAILLNWREPHASDRDALSSPDSPNDDVRLALVLRHLEQGLHSPLRAVEVAQLVHLSPSRFLHWFTDSLGLPFRAYVRWLRLQAAVRSLAQGGNLTEAAYLAGFADSAHLSRTFVSAFGITPNSLAEVEITVSDNEFPMRQIAHALNAKPTGNACSDS